MAGDDLTLHAEGIARRHGSRLLLHRSDLALPCGAVTALLGRNGAGKSTLMTLISGQTRPDGGRIRYGGTDIATARPTDLALMRGYLPQHARFAFAHRVREIVALGRLPHAGRASCRNDREAVTFAIESHDLADLAERDVNTLSGGERQRVRLARLAAQLHERIAAHRPAWLLLDEPNAGLDIDQQHRLMARLAAGARQGLGIVVVLHDLALAAAYADRVLLLEEGRIVEHGLAAEVLSPAVIRARFGMAACPVALPEGGRGLWLLPATGRQAGMTA